MNEFEQKSMLTEKAYNYLRQTMCNGMKSTIQTNYYFDTDDLDMNKQQITCRVRLKNGIYKATIKSHNSQCNIEEDIEISKALNKDVFSQLGLKLQGELVTERIVVSNDGICEIVLDRNTYLGITDYELEVEYVQGYDDIADGIVRTMLDMLIENKVIINGEMVYYNRSKSKSERFFERKLLLSMDANAVYNR